MIKYAKIKKVKPVIKLFERFLVLYIIKPAKAMVKAMTMDIATGEVYLSIPENATEYIISPVITDHHGRKSALI